MNRKFLVIMLTMLFLASSIISANASESQQYDTNVGWCLENGEFKAIATFDYKKVNDQDIDLFLLELYKDGELLMTDFHSTAWGSGNFPAEGIVQSIDMNEVIAGMGNGTYTFRVGACSDTFEDFNQHWDTQQLNVLAWSDMSSELVYTLPETQLKTPIITSFANGTFDYYIADSDYIGSVYFSLRLKTGSGSNSKTHMLSYESLYSEFDRAEWCSDMIDSYNNAIAGGNNAELTLSIFTTSNDTTKALSSQTATMKYAEATTSPIAPVLPMGPLTFEINNNEAILKSCDTSASGTITIPSHFDGYPVTRISTYAFLRCKDITTVTIPNTVKRIGPYAFSWCTGLKSVIIPDSVTSMGNGCFWHCENLVELKLPRYINSVPAWTCEGCYSLAEIIIPDTATFIGESAFKYCRSLTKVSIPSSVQRLINGCFCYCEGLKEVNISYGAITLDRAVFSKCAKLEKVTIPHSVKFIGIYAFDYAVLKDVYYTGSETEWNDIIVYIRNEPLENATKHYNWEIPEQIELVPTTVMKKETADEYVFTVTTPEKVDNATVYVVLYGKNRTVIGIKAVDFNDTTATVEIDKNTDAEISSIFLWDGSQQPASTVSTIDL